MRKTLIALAGLALAAAPLSAAHAVTFEVSADVPQQADLGTTIPITGHVYGVTTKGYTVDIHANYYDGKGEEPALTQAKVKAYAKTHTNAESTIHVGHADVHSSGNFTKSYTPPKGGQYYFTVEVDDKNGNPVGMGYTSQLLVFRWTALQNLNMVPGEETPVENAGKTTGKSVAGVKWTHELFLRDHAALDFNWDLPCTQVQSYVGISDSAPSGTTATTRAYQYAADSYLIELDQTRGDKARHFTRDLDPELGAGLELSALFGEGTDTVGKKVIFGEPKAFCAID
jgi:hypothetical protein